MPASHGAPPPHGRPSPPVAARPRAARPLSAHSLATVRSRPAHARPDADVLRARAPSADTVRSGYPHRDRERRERKQEKSNLDDADGRPALSSSAKPRPASQEAQSCSKSISRRIATVAEISRLLHSCNPDDVP
ncbi:hypothetical protein CDD83_1741 [Cordyceps sp. RAO-2017]|nr:hypothetical protein CDD83_1741 [Cordyceps sp. RAO-2017]